jgi:NAD(P)-dependent dehydrogenase (short-subunit alcohol dehydrogenase family)
MRAPDQQTALVTGSTDGLGSATAHELVAAGLTVLVHGRSPDKVERTVGALESAGGAGRVRGYVADLGSLREVRRLAETLADGEPRLELLINNAGTFQPSRELSADGFELTFAVNYLSHFLLTLELLPLLERSAPARIINVASIGQAPLDFADVMLEGDYDGYRAYAQSKLAQISFTIELAGRLRAWDIDEVTVNALHPATLMDTNMVRQSFGRPLSSVREGVDATVRLALAPELEGVSGRYFDRRREACAQDQAYAASARRRLWQLSERLTGLGESASRPDSGDDAPRLGATSHHQS